MARREALFGSVGTIDHGPVGPGHKALSPELDALPERGGAGRGLKTGAINRHDETAVGNGMGALR